MAITGFYEKVNGIKIYCETNNGPDDEATVICLHTAGRENRQYHELMDLLADKYRLISFDMPGHGKSWPLPGNKVVNNFRDYGKWIWDVVTALDVENPIIMGCSMGGNICYYMGINYPVRAIVPCQGADYTPNIAPEVLYLLDHPYVSCQHSHLEFTECLIGRKTSQERKDFIFWGVRQEIGIVKQGDLTQYNGFDVRDQVCEIACPTLIIHGLDDTGPTDEMARRTTAKMKKCQNLVYKPIEGYGHFIIVEAPEIVAEALDEFIRTL